jgi:hypothetical protein
MANEVQLEVLRTEFKQIEEELIQKHFELGMSSSGKWRKSLKTEVYLKDNNRLVAQITGLNYTEQLAFGRRPGKFPPISAIEQWIKDKPINFIETEISISSLAFLIARKIATEGTKYFQQGGTDLIQSVVTPERIQRILDSVGNAYIQPIVSGLISQLQSIPKAQTS